MHMYVHGVFITMYIINIKYIIPIIEIIEFYSKWMPISFFWILNTVTNPT